MTNSRIARAVVAAAVLLASPSPSAAADAVVVGSYSRLTVHGLEMRSGPGAQHSAVRAIDKGEVVRVVSGPHACTDVAGGCVGGWYEAIYRTWRGYLPRDGLAHTGFAGKSLARQFDRIIVVSLARQQVEVWERGRLVLITAATTGKPETPTPLGRFKILAKRSPFVFRSPYPPGHPEWYGDSPVEYAIKFLGGGGYALHDAPWRPRGGYGYKTNELHVDPDGRARQGSHGCVNLPLWATEWMWSWSRLGDVVQVVND